VIEPETPGAPAVSIEIEAVLTKRIQVMPWRDLLDPAKWVQGWV
jgi:tryptophan-rich hypothetical protein